MHSRGSVLLRTGVTIVGTKIGREGYVWRYTRVGARR